MQIGTEKINSVARFRLINAKTTKVTDRPASASATHKKISITLRMIYEFAGARRRNKLIYLILFLRGFGEGNRRGTIFFLSNSIFDQNTCH